MACTEFPGAWPFSITITYDMRNGLTVTWQGQARMSIFRSAHPGMEKEARPGRDQEIGEAVLNTTGLALVGLSCIGFT